MPLKLSFEKFVIMNEKRTKIAKGVPRNRYLVGVRNAATDKKRLMYYDSENKAKAAFTVSGFYNQNDDEKLEPVPVTITIKEKDPAEEAAKKEICTLFHKCWGSDSLSSEYAKTNWGRLQYLLSKQGFNV